MSRAQSSSRGSRQYRRGPGGRLGAFLGAVVMSVVAGVLLTAALTPVVAVGGAATSSAISIFENLPDHIDPGELAQPSKLYAKDGDTEIEIAQFYAQNRKMVGWDQISQFAKDAVVAEEDPRFYSHGGVDVLAAARAAVGNVTGRSLSGASTVTMQYVRNVLVQEAEMIPDEEERNAAYENAMRQDIDRKLKEMKLAISVEKRFTKDEILLGYLNIANYGGTVYGIEAAAKRYYDTTAAQLTLPQAASLIAIVNSPNRLHLGNEENYEANKERRDLILYSMLDEGKITQEQYDAAVETPIEVKLTQQQAGCQMATENGLGHFCNYVTLQIQNDPLFGDTPEARMFNLQRGGYKIETTIDLDMQRAAQESMDRHVPATHPGFDIGSTVVSVEVGTGRVLAMAQNRKFADDPDVLNERPDLTPINYATDFEYGGSHGFQAGSIFKAFTLAEWVRSGHSVREVLNANARTVQLSDFQGACLGGPYGFGTWKFQNDSNKATGQQPVTRITNFSVNGGFVSMAQRLDLCDIFSLAQDMGVHRAAVQDVNEGLNNFGTKDLTIAPSNTFAGVDEVAPISLATAYAGFAGKGKVCSPIPIDRVLGPDGKEVPITPSNCRQAIDEEVAAAVAFVLSEGVRSGYAQHARSAYGVPHFAKTGTTNNRVDDWTVGASSKVATALWLGNVTGKRNLGDFGLYRSHNIQVWPDVMRVADEKYGGDAFPTPTGTSIQQRNQKVPDVSDRSVEEAVQILRDAGFTVGDTAEEDSELEAGRVIGTDPAAGAEVAQGSTVNVRVSNGKAPAADDDDTADSGTQVPGGLIGPSAQEAARILNGAGYTSVFMQCRSNATPDASRPVVSVSPAEGANAATSARVTLTLNC